MSKQRNSEVSTPMPDNDSEKVDAINIADVIPLFAPEHEELDPKDLDDEEIIDYFTSLWAHPSTQARLLAETINQHKKRDGDPWHDRLATIVETSTNKTSEAMETDAVLLGLYDFLRQTVTKSADFAEERKAVRTLIELCETSLNRGEETSAIGAVFSKMLHVRSSQ